MSNNSKLQQNNSELEAILQIVNELPEGNNVELPSLKNKAQASDLLINKELLDDNGVVVTGTMPNNGKISFTMDGINVKSVSVPKGYTSGGTVSLTNDIDNEVTTQTDLIAQIKNAVNNLPEAGSGSAAVNLFDIGNVRTASTSSYSLSKPIKVENGVIYSGGIAGDSEGEYAYIFVQPGDVIRFKATVSGQSGVITFLSASSVSADRIFQNHSTIGNHSISGGNVEKYFAIPEGAYCFGFAAYSAERYGMQLTNIAIEKTQSSAAEQAAALAILMGEAL